MNETIDTLRRINKRRTGSQISRTFTRREASADEPLIGRIDERITLATGEMLQYTASNTARRVAIAACERPRIRWRV